MKRKAVSELATEGKVLNLMKNIEENLLYGGRLFSPWDWEKNKSLLLSPLFHIVLEANAVSQKTNKKQSNNQNTKTGIRGICIRKEELILSLFADDRLIQI